MRLKIYFRNCYKVFPKIKFVSNQLLIEKCSLCPVTVFYELLVSRKKEVNTYLESKVSHVQTQDKEILKLVHEIRQKSKE